MKSSISLTLMLFASILVTACTNAQPQPPQSKQWEGFKDIIQKNILDTDNIIKSYVDKKCHAKINDYRAWCIFSYVLSDKKKYYYEQKVCDCATEEAVKQVTPSDVLNIVKPSTREKTLANLTENVTKACIKRMI